MDQPDAPSQTKITDFFPTAHRIRGKRKTKDLPPVTISTPSKTQRIEHIRTRSQRIRDLALAQSPVKLKPKDDPPSQSNPSQVETLQPEPIDKQVPSNVHEAKTCQVQVQLPSTSTTVQQTVQESTLVASSLATPTKTPIKLLSNKPVLSPLKFAEGKPILSPIKFSSPKKPLTPAKRINRSLNVDFDQSFSLDAARKSSDFCLPHHYQALADIFDSMDKVLCLLIGSKQQPTYEKVKRGVERMVKKALDPIKLAQIKTVYPQSISYTYEKAAVIDGKDLVSKMSNVLIITPTKLSDPSDPNSPLVPIDQSSLMKSDRSKEFVTRLYDMTKKHHQQFLESLNSSFRVDHDKLVRWHPNFKVHSLPPIEYKEDALPLRPDNKVTNSKFIDIVEKLRAKNLQQKDPSGPSTSATIKNTCSVVKSESGHAVSADGKIQSGALKGLSIALLNKVKAREAQKIAREMTRPPQVEQKLKMLAQFPDFSRILKFYFIGEGKTVLPIEQVSKKLIESYPSFMSSNDAVERLNYMAKVLPDWLMILKVKSGTFVKILNKDANLNALHERIGKLQEEMEKAIS